MTETVPAGYDQVARLHVFRAAWPDARTWHYPPLWYGAMHVGRWTWTTGPKNDLRPVLDILDDFAAIELSRRAAETLWAGWHVCRLSPLSGWTAWREYVRVDAVDLDDLGARIGAVEQSVRWAAGWAVEAAGR